MKQRKPYVSPELVPAGTFTELTEGTGGIFYDFAGLTSDYFLII